MNYSLSSGKISLRLAYWKGSNWSGGAEAIPCQQGQSMKKGIARESGGILLGYPVHIHRDPEKLWV